MLYLQQEQNNFIQRKKKQKKNRSMTKSYGNKLQHIQKLTKVTNLQSEHQES